MSTDKKFLNKTFKSLTSIENPGTFHSIMRMLYWGYEGVLVVMGWFRPPPKPSPTPSGVHMEVKAETGSQRVDMLSDKSQSTHMCMTETKKLFADKDNRTKHFHTHVAQIPFCLIIWFERRLITEESRSKIKY